MTDNPAYNEDAMRKAGMARVAQVKKNYDARKLKLENMQTSQLRELANDYLLPHDLNHTQLVNAILAKEFPSR